jgi:hypothetical protein
MHGIVRTRILKAGTEPSYKNIHRVEVHYLDGRVVCFMPEAPLTGRTSASTRWITRDFEGAVD